MKNYTAGKTPILVDLYKLTALDIFETTVQKAEDVFHQTLSRATRYPVEFKLKAVKLGVCA